MKLIGMIADHPTPKISVGGGTAYTLNSRDYKGVMLVVLSKGICTTEVRSVQADGTGIRSQSERL